MENGETTKAYFYCVIFHTQTQTHSHTYAKQILKCSHFLRKFARNSKHNKTLSKAVYTTAHRRIRSRIDAYTHTHILKNSTFALFYRMSCRSGHGIALNSAFKNFFFQNTPVDSNRNTPVDEIVCQHQR